MMNREVKIGLTILSACLLMYLFITWIRQTHLFAPDRVQYTFRFSNASGLLNGDPVTYLGIPVGKVQEIQFSGSAVHVIVQIDKEIAITKDAVPHLMVRELMGGKVIDVVPGESAAHLSPGGTLSGVTDLDFQGAFRDAGSVFSAIRPGMVDSLIQNLSRLSEDLARMTSGIETGTLQHSLQNLNATTSSLNDLLSEVRRQNLIQEMEQMLADVSHLTLSADSALDAVTGLSLELKDNFLPRTETTLNNVDRSLLKADTLLVRMNMVSGMLLNDSTFAGAMLSDPKWTVKMDSTLHNLNRTLEHLRNKKVHVQLSLSPKQKSFEE